MSSLRSLAFNLCSAIRLSCAALLRFSELKAAIIDKKMATKMDTKMAIKTPKILASMPVSYKQFTPSNPKSSTDYSATTPAPRSHSLNNPSV